MSTNQDLRAASVQRMRLYEQMEQAKRFRYMLSDVGLTIDQAANLLHETRRTVERWTTGTRPIPYSAFKCIRLMRHMELPGEEWRGWTFHSGVLWSPEGFSLRPLEVSWWGHMVRKARLFTTLYERQSQLDGLVYRMRNTPAQPLPQAAQVEGGAR